MALLPSNETWAAERSVPSVDCAIAGVFRADRTRRPLRNDLTYLLLNGIFDDLSTKWTFVPVAAR